jgi:hypothetical protein
MQHLIMRYRCAILSAYRTSQSKWLARRMEMCWAECSSKRRKLILPYSPMSENPLTRFFLYQAHHCRLWHFQFHYFAGGTLSRSTQGHDNIKLVREIHSTVLQFAKFSLRFFICCNACFTVTCGVYLHFSWDFTLVPFCFQMVASKKTGHGTRESVGRDSHISQ